MNVRDRRLDDVAMVFNGKTPSQEEQQNNGFPVLKIKDVSDNGRFIGFFDSYVSFDYANEFVEKVVCSGDSLILNAAHNADYVGSKVYFAEPSVVGSLPTGEWLVIRPNHHEADPRYINFWLQSTQIRRKIKNLVKGIHLYPKDVANLSIGFPHLSEQKLIAIVLAKADRLRRQRRYSLELSGTYLQSVFLEMFHEKAAEEWPNASIESLAKGSKGAIRTGPFGSQLLHSEFVDEGIAVLGIDNAVQNRFSWGELRFITEEKYQQLKRYTVFPGDIIITIMGTPGRCAVIPNKFPQAINTKHLCCITLDQSLCLPNYLKFCFLTHPLVLRQLHISERGAVMPGLNMDIIKELIIPCPPLPLQERFSQIVQKHERILAQQREALRQAEHLFQTLLHQAFQGELTSSTLENIQSPSLETINPQVEVSLNIPDEIDTNAYQLALPLE